MRSALPRRGALGLRGRIVGALLVSTVATLAVAALALLGPLEHSLRNAEQKTLQARSGQEPQALASSRLTRSLLSLPARQSVISRQQQIIRQTGATVVTFLGYPDANGNGSTVLLAAARRHRRQ